MAKLRQFFLSLVLTGIAALILVSILFYHVSAVKIYQRDQLAKRIDMVMTLHNLTACTFVSETDLPEYVLTLKCQSPVFNDRIVHVNARYQILGQLNPAKVQISAARSAFIAQTGLSDFKLTLTFYKNNSVYWVTSGNTEWLLDIEDYSILWKVDKNYE